MTESNARNDEAKSESRNRFGKKKIVELGLLLVILAVAAFTLAQKDFKRFGQLFHDGAVAAQQWDEERTKFKQSQAAFKEIEAGISSEKASLELTFRQFVFKCWELEITSNSSKMSDFQCFLTIICDNNAR